MHHPLFFLMIRRPPRATLTDPLFPYTALFRSPYQARRGESSGQLNELRHVVVGEHVHDGAHRQLLEVRPTGENREERGVGGVPAGGDADERSEEHTSELQSLMRISYAVFCLKK